MERTTAEILLLSEGILEGTYLLRKSRRHDGFAVSVRCQGCVKHFVLIFQIKTQCYLFGNATFETLRELLDHFESCPILTRENGVFLLHDFC
jgi:SH2 domain.